MSILRRIILAAALMAGIVPAFGQGAPPPVPALPDLERRTSYAITGSTCVCAVNMALYGDSTDFQNWIEVWINGRQVQYNDATFGWTITSPTGQLALIPRPITDAVLTFNSAQTGTIQIVGARRPRRVSQFAENRGVAARDLNQAVTDITAVLREMWDKTNDMTGRGLFSQPGNIVGPLPQPSACALGLLGFDGSGLNPVCVPQSGSGVIALPSVSTFTSSHTIAPTDCNSIIKMGTGSTWPLTLTLPGSTTGFTGPCPIYVVGQSTRGVKLSGFSGLGLTSPTLLWPTKSFSLAIVGGAWVLMAGDGRWFISSPELCVRQDGDDTADGLGNGTVASECLAHVQTAVNLIGKTWDGTGYGVCAIGIYGGGTSIINESVSQTGQSMGCYITVNMRGNIRWTNSLMCWTTGDDAITIFNFTFGASVILQCNTSNTALTGQFYGHQQVIYDINGTFEWIPGGSNDDLIVMDAQGRATLGLTTLVVGDANIRAARSIMNCNFGCRGLQISGVVAFSPNMTLGQAYILHATSLINAGASYTGSPTVGATSTPTGNSVLITNGTTIPGGTTPTAPGSGCSQNSLFGLVCLTPF